MENFLYSNKIGNYTTFLIFFALAPLLPLLTEGFMLSEISSRTIVVTAAMYAVAVSSYAKSRTISPIAMGISIIFCVFYGAILVDTNNQDLQRSLYSSGMITIPILFCLNAIDGYYRYIKSGEEIGS